SALLQDDLVPPRGFPVVEGPHFVYAQGQRLFLGRRGRGPLRIAWDTNLLIDYFQHGRALWNGDCMTDLVPGVRGEELEGLQIVMATWVIRDIRFYIPRRVLRDAKKQLTRRQLGQRL